MSMALQWTLLVVSIIVCTPSLNGKQNLRRNQRQVCEGEEVPAFCKGVSLPGGLFEVDCHGIHLTNLPRQLPKKTKVVNLTGNSIRAISDYSFQGCDDLRSLDLSNNLIDNITTLAFADTSLDSLYLSGNQLNLSSMYEISPSVFTLAGSIKMLEIHNNTMEHTSYVSGNLYQNLTLLKHLTLDGHPDAIFQGGFNNLNNLRTLVIKGNQSYIRNETFEIFENIPLLNLSISSGLIDVDKMAFGHFHQLEILDLSYNPLLGFPNASKSWYGLRFTNLTSLILERSAPYDYELITINESFTRELKHTKVKKIVLDGNNIIIANASFRINTPDLEYLSIAYNRLVQVELLMCDLYFLKKLLYFSAASQNKRLPDDGKIYGDSAYRRSVKNEAYELKSSDPLNETCQGSIFRFDDPAYISFPKRLEYINLAGTLTESLQYMGEVRLLGQNSMKYFIYANNGLHKLKGPIIMAHPPPTLMTIDMSQNDCSEMSPDFLKFIGEYISHLYLGQNRLGEQLANDLNCSTFQYLTPLNELDLSFNMIKHLPVCIFANQKELKMLNLSHNSLQFLTFDLSHMKLLTYLDLSVNLIAQIDSHYTNRWLSPPDGHNFSLNLQDNPLICSCDSVLFLEWLIETQIVVENWQNYTCTYDRDLHKLKEIGHILTDLNVECKSNQWVIASAITFGFVGLIVGIAIALFRFRFQVKVFCLKLTYQWKQYQPLYDTRNYKYDAFVAFHKDELQFVKDELVENLERDDNIKLCVHHRDFHIGAGIEENILGAISKSRKTILVLSKRFLESGWCEFEYDMARVRGFDEGVDIILPIIKGGMPDERHLSRSLKSLLRKNTYIEWPEHSNELRQEFWIKLKIELRRPQRNIQTELPR